LEIDPLCPAHAKPLIFRGLGASDAGLMGPDPKRVIKGWISFYNSDRPHTALDKRTPDNAFFNAERTLKAA